MNWTVTEEAGGYFKREWIIEKGNLITPLENAQVKKVKECRAWDIAASLPSEVYPNPDYTACVKMSLGEDGCFYVEHAFQFRERIHDVQQRMRETAELDGYGCWVVFPDDPGAAGKIASASHAKNLAGFKYKKAKTSARKIERYLPFVSAAQAGLVKFVKADYYKDPRTGETFNWEKLFSALEVDVGSRSVKDDLVDSIADAFDQLANGKRIVDNIDISVGLEESSWNVA